MQDAAERWPRTLVVVAGVVIALCALAPGAAAQTVTGTMQGTVKDTNDAVVTGATVTIRNVETGQERTATTNSEGFFVAPFLPIGRYEATAAQSGFGPVKREGLEVTLNQTAVADFTLNPTVSEEVTVVT